MQPWGFIFHYWFLGEVLFKSDLPGVVFEMGFYLSETTFQPLFIAFHSIHWSFSGFDKSLVYCVHLFIELKSLTEQQEIIIDKTFLNFYQHYHTFEWIGWIVFNLGFYCFKIGFWLGLYYFINVVKFYSRVGLFCADTVLKFEAHI